MAKPNVFVTRVIPNKGLDLVKDFCDADVWQGDLPPNRDELLKHVQGVDGLLCLLTDKIDGELMEAAGSQLKVISNFAVGFDNVDVNAATTRKIPIGNTPGVLTDATADLAFVKKRQLATAERIEEDLRQLAKETGLKYGSKELFLRATRDSRILEGQVFDPALLYTGANFVGNSLGAAMPLPDLTWWPGMNNSITSVQMLGACILYRGTYFRGSSLWLLGVPYFQVASLAGTSFNNAASSVYAHVY